MILDKIIKNLGCLSKHPNQSAFIVEIEGTDRSGKETQTQLLYDRLTNLGLRVKTYSFPKYDSSSSIFVKEYLNGHYGDINDISAEQASLLFAVDRLHTYLTDISKIVRDYDVIIFDRYIGSNLIHQAAKFCSNDEKIDFINYWYEFEVQKLGLPRPDLTILLDMPVECGKRIAKNRVNKITKENDQDIHESNDGFMQKSYKTAKLCEDELYWESIKCYNNIFGYKKVRSIKSISNELFMYTILNYYLSVHGICIDPANGSHILIDGQIPPEATKERM